MERKTPRDHRRAETIMANLELDPLFVKALKLLHSKSKDSADQLKQLYDDVVAQRKGETVKKEFKDGEKSSRQSSKVEEDKKREAEKRTFEKVKQDLSELTSQAGKKPRLDTTKDVKDKPREKERGRDKDREREKEKERERKEKESRDREKKEAEKRELEKKVKQEVTLISSESEEEKSLDANDFAYDLGISCIACSSFDVQSTNQLVECQECHNLYHQDCHVPPVTEQEVNDPRSVWYCSQCAKTLKKMVAVKPSKPKVTSASSGKESANNGKQGKNEPTALFPFRRSEPIKPSSSRDTSSAAKPLSGLVSLAANLSGKGSVESSKSKSENSRHGSVKTDSKSSVNKSDPNRVSGNSSGSKSDQSDRISSSGQSSKLKSSSSGSHKPSGQGGASSAISADKRLQMMKKKAAANKLKSGTK